MPVTKETKPQLNLVKLIPAILTILGAFGVSVGGQYVGIGPPVEQTQVNEAVRKYMDEAIAKAGTQVDLKVENAIAKALDKVDGKIDKQMDSISNRIRAILESVKESISNLETIISLKIALAEKDIQELKQAIKP